MTDPTEPDQVVRIVGALVHPIGPAPEPETVTLFNTSPGPIQLAGWTFADKLKNVQTLTRTIAAGVTLTIPVQSQVQLGNSGGVISLLDDRRPKVGGVSLHRAAGAA